MGWLWTGCLSTAPVRSLEMLQPGAAPCYDRASEPQTAIVDAHLHFRPFGGPAIPYREVLSYLKRSGVLFVNVYGIGQMLPVTSPCTYYLDCPGTPALPTLKNDFANAASFFAEQVEGVHVTLSMTFADLSRPASVMSGIELLDREYPGAFKWMGELNLVKQALFENAHAPVPEAVISEWADFMHVLRERSIPLAIHADLGNDEDPTLYLPLVEEMLRLYPDNTIVWMHMGLSKELVNMNPNQHIRIVRSLLDRYPKLMVDVSWRVIYDNYFKDPGERAEYVAFLNEYSARVLPGSDFVASADKDLDVYRAELAATSDILRNLEDDAFRNIALGGNYFRILSLDYEAQGICE